MFDIINELYNLVDENLPIHHYPDPAYQALLISLSPEQHKLFDAYYSENLDREDEERRILFRYLVKPGLHIP